MVDFRQSWSFPGRSVDQLQPIAGPIWPMSGPSATGSALLRPDSVGFAQIWASSRCCGVRCRIHRNERTEVYLSPDSAGLSQVRQPGCTSPTNSPCLRNRRLTNTHFAGVTLQLPPEAQPANPEYGLPCNWAGQAPLFVAPAGVAAGWRGALEVCLREAVATSGSNSLTRRSSPSRLAAGTTTSPSWTMS